MIYLNLDPEFNQASKNVIKHKLFTFGGGEPHIVIEPFTLGQQVCISHRLTNFNKVGELLIAVDALRRMGVKNISAFLPYFPGARQDSPMNSGEAFTAKVYAELINSCRFSAVEIYDAHSDVTGALVNNSVIRDNYFDVRRVLEIEYPQTVSKTVPLIVSPDAGAEKKSNKLIQYLNHFNKAELCYAGKNRDRATGKLSGFRVFDKAEVKGRDCIIVDDVCDGGGTFIGLGELLREAGAKRLILFVSHGIFYKGFKGLNKVFNAIYTTDSFFTETNPEWSLTHDRTYDKLTQLKISALHNGQYANYDDVA